MIPAARQGFALISTLLVITVLTIMIVAFMQSMRIERISARNMVEKVRAEMAAETAFQEASQQLLNTLVAYPDAATVWEDLNGAQGTPATLLYYHVASPATAAAAVRVLPLVSGGVDKPVANKSDSLPQLTSTNSVDLNQAAFSGDRTSWVGTKPDGTVQAIRAKWQDVKDSNNNVVARYAFWIEDESFKVNLNQMGSVERGAATQGALPSEIPLQGILDAMASQLGGAGGLNTAAARTAFAVDTVTARNALTGFDRIFPSYRFWNTVEPSGGAFPADFDLAATMKYVSTINSSSLNLSRNGSKRVNLNGIITTSNVPAEIRGQLDRIIQTIEFHMPNFGQRFYRTNATNLNDVTQVSAGDATIYLQKLAANIRDYVDTDSQPTVIDDSFDVTNGSVPDRAIGFNSSNGTPNDTAAEGKEAVPYLQEYVLKTNLVSMTPPSGAAASQATYVFELDHYFEFWNPTTRDVTLQDLGSNPFIKIYNQMAWDTGGGLPNIGPGRDFKIPLADFRDGSGAQFRIPAGGIAVLTTDGSPSANLVQVPVASVFRPQNPNSYLDISGSPSRRLTGITKSKDSSNYFRANPQTRSTSSSDYATEILIGNDDGILDSFCALSMTTGLSVRANNPSIMFRGSSLRGNSGSSPNLSETGDPRTLNEQLYINRYTTAFTGDQTRFYDSGNSNASPPSSGTMGLPNSNFVLPDRWPDKTPALAGANTAPMRMANARLDSIGQLGDVYDPVRSIGTGGINYSRGGARTLRIGQSEKYVQPNATDPRRFGLWDGLDSASRNWAAWRLTDAFDVQNSIELPGLININGIRRDDGAALGVALYGYIYAAAPDGDSSLAGKRLDQTIGGGSPPETSLKRFMNGLKTYLTANQAIWERGELSELPYFNTPTSADSDTNRLLSGVDMDSSMDRGREELFRRLSQLITTRGNTFTVYVVGQSLNSRGGNVRVLASDRARITFKLTPVFATTPDDGFNPQDPTAVQTRFAKPTSYDISIVSIER